jgi:hypothetical protein
MSTPALRRASALTPFAVALGAWALLAALGVLARHHVAHDALSPGPQALPLALGLTLLMGTLAWGVWRGVTPRFGALALGLAGGWVTFTVLVVLAGTPYGIGGPLGDCGRTLVAAERFRGSWHSADGFLQGVPAEYPPLWFWLWGRLAAVRGVEAWRVMALYQGAMLGLAVVACGFAWRLVTTSWARALGAALGSTAWVYAVAAHDPCKGHESTSFLLAAPVLLWASLCVGRVTRDRLLLGRALAWGAAVGLLLSLYQLPLLFSAPWLLLLWGTWAVRARTVPAVLLHLVAAGAGALLTAGWYVVPFVHEAVTGEHGHRPADLLMVTWSLEEPAGLPVELGSLLLLPLLAGLLLAARRVHQRRAQALLVLVGGGLAVQLLALWNVVSGGESFYSYKAAIWLPVLLVGACALLVERESGGPWFAVPQATLRLTGGALVLALAPTVAFDWWGQVHAHVVPHQTLEPTYEGNDTDRAYRLPLPSCRRVTGLPASEKPLTCFPGSMIDRCIRQEHPSGLPVVLSDDDRISGFYGYHQVLPSNSGAVGPFDEWTRRFTWVRSLAATTDPLAFAHAARQGPYGEVAAIVLQRGNGKQLRYRTIFYYRSVYIDFTSKQFPGDLWRTCEDNHFIVMVRRAGV